MTDKEKLEKVKAEIERRKESLKPHGGQGLVVTRLMRELCDDFFSFIDSMQKEPASEDLEKEVCRYINDNDIQKLDNILIKEGIVYVGVNNIKDIARHFANWQKQQMMAKAVDGFVIEDIEEGNGDFLLSAEYLPKNIGLKDRQKVKVIVIKDN